MKKFINILNEDNLVTSTKKIAFYYLISQILLKGMSFITTPIFSRVMSQEEYGMFSNFLAYEALIYPIVTLNMREVINKSKYDYDKENNNFLFSIMLASQLLSLFIYTIIEINYKFFQDIFKIDIIYIRFLFLYIILFISFDYQQLQYGVYKKYKQFIFLTIINSFFSLSLSLAFVCIMENKVLGRILGIIIPTALISCFIIFNIYNQGKKFSFIYIKYAVRHSIILLPAVLSSIILASSDRIMITRFCGSNNTALYTIAYIISSIATIIWTAINQAWGPWMLDNLSKQNFNEIKKASQKMSFLYIAIMLFLMLIAPEILYFFGGEKYLKAINAMPPVILAMMFQFFSSFYYNIEYFYGKNYMISTSAILAAIINIILNFIFIPKYGYVAAAYTTLIGYIVMFVYHVCLVNVKLRKSFILDQKIFVITIVILCLCQCVIYYLYILYIVRYLLILIYGIFIFILILKNKKILLKSLTKG